MAINVADNFSYQGAKPLDARLTYPTLAAMAAVTDATMYEGCIAYCVATDKTYQWKSGNTVDADTGKWREFTDISSCYKTDDVAENAIDDADYVPFYDSSATAKKKSLWSNIKSLLKTYFDTLYQPKLEYSTSEKAVGKWINGSTIYRCTYTGTISGSTGNYTVQSSFSYTPIKYEGVAFSSSMNVPINATANGGSSSVSISPFKLNGALMIANSNSMLTGATYYLTVYYIK